MVTKVWLFDIDGTLIASGNAGLHGMSEAFEQSFGVQPDLSGTAFAGRTDRSITMEVFERHSIPTNLENWNQFSSCYARLLPKHLEERQGHVLPGVLNLIDRLRKQMPCRLGLLTGNMELAAEHKLRHYELWEHFEFGGYGDHHVDRADVARVAIDRIGSTVDPEDVWVVGDTPHDITCARAVGANVIAVATGGFSRQQLAAHEPDLLLEDLADPAPVFEAVYGD